jgi:hypothetical protein
MTVSLLPRAEAYNKSVTPTACDKDDLRFTEKKTIIKGVTPEGLVTKN